MFEESDEKQHAGAISSVEHLLVQEGDRRPAIDATVEDRLWDQSPTQSRQGGHEQQSHRCYR